MLFSGRFREKRLHNMLAHHPFPSEKIWVRHSVNRLRIYTNLSIRRVTENLTCPDENQLVVNTDIFPELYLSRASASALIFEELAWFSKKFKQSDTSDIATDAQCKRALTLASVRVIVFTCWSSGSHGRLTYAVTMADDFAAGLVTVRVRSHPSRTSSLCMQQKKFKVHLHYAKVNFFFY